ncbi:hypothetical protein BDM02DRAFT_3190136 [Thelephora ganbajun]|uniref:Uncharacterized protein n=1 Tax=Thelephora ganbajun TaxID=370292 RepID=A0ACB6Z6F2_THEGA|nr:hypothetical protein BDM02DRAFT_3190136 [Thelephora ganbajun]
MRYETPLGLPLDLLRAKLLPRKATLDIRLRHLSILCDNPMKKSFVASAQFPLLPLANVREFQMLYPKVRRIAPPKPPVFHPSFFPVLKTLPITSAIPVCYTSSPLYCELFTFPIAENPRPDAERVIEKMQGFLIGDSRIRLSWGHSQSRIDRSDAKSLPSVSDPDFIATPVTQQKPTLTSPENRRSRSSKNWDLPTKTSEDSLSPLLMGGRRPLPSEQAIKPSCRPPPPTGPEIEEGSSELSLGTLCERLEAILQKHREPLAADDRGNSVEESNILGRAQFLKDRARYKAEGRVTTEASALVAFRGRFNLFAKFVSEIFIRVAWKLYERGAFNTLISLLPGLQSERVVRAVGKRWGKLGSSEARVYRDLRPVADPSGDFRYLRQVEAAIEAERISVNPHDSSAIGADASPMGKGKGGRKDSASHRLEPLINVQKQRRMAGVIKSLVMGQHLTGKLQFPIDKKLFQRCLRLKALGEDTLFRVYAMYPD